MVGHAMQGTVDAASPVGLLSLLITSKRLLAGTRLGGATDVTHLICALLYGPSEREPVVTMRCVDIRLDIQPVKSNGVMDRDAYLAETLSNHRWWLLQVETTIGNQTSDHNIAFAVNVWSG